MSNQTPKTIGPFDTLAWSVVALVIAYPLGLGVLYAWNAFVAWSWQFSPWSPLF